MLDPITNVSASEESSSFTITVDSTYTPYSILSNMSRLNFTLQFESPAVCESFQASFNSFQDTLKAESANPPGVIPAFSRLYYGCGIVFQMVPISELGHF